MGDWHDRIRNWMQKAGDSIIGRPHLPSATIRKLRAELIKEETTETLDAMAMSDIGEIADGIADSIVVLIGTAISYGIDIRPVMQMVLDSNDAKIVDGVRRREDGKILKPANWRHPDIMMELVQQGFEP